MKTFEELLKKKLEEVGEFSEDDFIAGARWAHSLTGWRKYPEEKPEKYGKYQVTLLNLMTKEKYVDYRIALNGQFKMGMLKVIAWMPIPEPFEEK